MSDPRNEWPQVDGEKLAKSMKISARIEDLAEEGAGVHRVMHRFCG
jgi:hypothetical protein